MKALMDRHYCLAKNTSSSHPIYLLENKATMLLSTCGGAADENADLLRAIFEREMAYLHCRIIGEHVLPLCSSPSEVKPRARQLAHRMLQDVIACAGS